MKEHMQDALALTHLTSALRYAYLIPLGARIQNVVQSAPASCLMVWVLALALFRSPRVNPSEL